AFFARLDADIAEREVDDLVRSACRHWKRPVFIYAGVNSRLPKLPGTRLPAKLRRPILVQLRDTSTDEHHMRFDRFQLIDSDFASANCRAYAFQHKAAQQLAAIAIAKTAAARIELPRFVLVVMKNSQVAGHSANPADGSAHAPSRRCAEPSPSHR